MKVINILSGNSYEITVTKETKTLIKGIVIGVNKMEVSFNKKSGRGTGWMSDYYLV